MMDTASTSFETAIVHRSPVILVADYICPSQALTASQLKSLMQQVAGLQGFQVNMNGMGNMAAAGNQPV